MDEGHESTHNNSGKSGKDNAPSVQPLLEAFRSIQIGDANVVDLVAKRPRTWRRLKLRTMSLQDSIRRRLAGQSPP